MFLKRWWKALFRRACCNGRVGLSVPQFLQVERAAGLLRPSLFDLHAGKDARGGVSGLNLARCRLAHIGRHDLASVRPMDPAIPPGHIAACSFARSRSTRTRTWARRRNEPGSAPSPHDRSWGRRSMTDGVRTESERGSLDELVEAGAPGSEAAWPGFFCLAFEKPVDPLQMLLAQRAEIGFRIHDRRLRDRAGRARRGCGMKLIIDLFGTARV
jgi:hypothetical protein